MRRKAPGILLACLLPLAGCGGGGQGSPAQSSAPAAPSKARLPLERAIRQSFPKPQPDPEVPGSAKAIKAGEAACGQRTPRQVVDRYAQRARLSEEQRQALSQLRRAEAHPGPDFAAGQIAAMVYEATLGGPAAEYGFRGCAYALARGVGHLEAESGR
jgi:hypothetical protein